MKKKSGAFNFFCLSLLLLALGGCKPKDAGTAVHLPEAKPPLFTLLGPEKTNIHFENKLTEGLNANVLMYEYLYNGGGIAAGDFNGDDLIDLYFTSNMGDNSFYLNQGNMNFREVAAHSGVSGRAGPWKTGITAADVNGDGLLDLYLCYSGALPPEKRKNQLFINMGNDENNVPIFEEMATAYGLDSPAFSNQAYFLDYDRDGDLDALLLNHNPKSLPVLNEVSTREFLKKDDPLQGVRLYRQTKGVFEDVTVASGISGSALTYGLGIGISDINNDGWVDFYVSNDYAVPDYLYINNGNGTFTNRLNESMGHTSHFSMGNDIADINNDGLQDIITLDMLPEDNRRQKLLLAPDNYEKFDLNLRSGFHYQYMRNMLQLNNGNGTFSEIGQLAGISNTDWSWAALLADYDNDGFKDLFVTNGYYRDYTNLDFINYMDDFVKSRGRLMREDVLDIIQRMPSSNLTNYYFSNKDGVTFSEETKTFGLDQAANSNGAAYADLDNDGDLDLIVNNINKPAYVYRNESGGNNANSLSVELRGAGKNTRGIGSKVFVYRGEITQRLEQMPTRGYLSTVSSVLHFGLGEDKAVDSLVVHWNGGKQQTLTDVNAGQRLILDENNALMIREARPVSNSLLAEVSSPISYEDHRAAINDFKRQSLLINQFSHAGPIMVKGDVNKDGLDDIYVGGGKGQAAALYLQQQDGAFIKQQTGAFEMDKDAEDMNAAIFDANGDGNADILVLSGGYHMIHTNDPLLQDRLYLGDGTGKFSRNDKALPEMRTSTAALAVDDVNGDGSPDVFIGGRVVPGRYPETPQSYLLINDGSGHFTDQAAILAPELQHGGMITDAKWTDINGDGAKDLVLVGEWMPLSIFINENGQLKNRTTRYFDTPYTGWWNTLEIEDFNRDGKPDLMAGNMGTNTQFKVTASEPAEMYYADFDQNGSVDPVFCYYVQGKSYPYLTRDELLGQLAGLRSEFTSYDSYADATITEIFSEEELSSAQKLTANHMETSLFLSSANDTYLMEKLPLQAQYSPVYSVLIFDFNSDGFKDIILFGNHHYFKLRLGKFDANYGTLLTGDGTGHFRYVDQLRSGLKLQGAVRSSILINDLLLLGINEEPIKAYQIKAPTEDRELK